MTALDKGGSIVQDVTRPRLPRYAHLVLPAAQWGEMNLTSINGERRLRLWQFMDAGHLPNQLENHGTHGAATAVRISCRQQVDIAARFSGFTWTSDEEVFRAAAVSVKGAQEDYRGHDLCHAEGTRHKRRCKHQCRE